jgi:hypothetical protein
VSTLPLVHKGPVVSRERSTLRTLSFAKRKGSENAARQKFCSICLQVEFKGIEWQNE